MKDILFFDFNQKSSVLLIFFFHAALFSFLILKKGIEEGRKDSLWLAVFIFLGGLYICPFMLGYAGWYNTSVGYWEFMFFVPFQQLFFIGPVFYFYIKALLDGNSKLSRTDLLNFLPGGLYLMYSLLVFVADKFILDEFYFYADGKDKDLDFCYQMAGLISMLFYLFLSLRHHRNYRKASLEELSYADEIAFKWIRYFALAFGLILLLRVLFFILNPEWGQFGSKYWYYLCFSILLLYISISGYSHTLKASTGLLSNPFPEMEPSRNEVNEKFNPPANEPLVQKEWKNKITRIFEEEQLYNNPNLTLSEVARLLHTNRNIISQAINREFDMNFNDFVNEKRAEAVIEKLQQGEHRGKTLLSIALDCGFNSKSTFNRAFKKHTDLTPKQYIAQHGL